jgi:lauroyl/myristoyl acyltransferase
MASTDYPDVPFQSSMLHPRYWPTWLGLAFASLLVQLPLSWRHKLGDKLGAYLYRQSDKRRNIARVNLRQAFPQLSEAELELKVKAHLRWYGRGLIDYSVFFFSGRQRLLEQVEIEGGEILEQAHSQQQPIILLLAHSVMLEFAVIALSTRYESFGSYKSSNNPVLDWMIARSRCRFADFVVPRDAGLRPLVRAIQSKRIMIFLPDEDLGLENAVFAPFFERQKATLTTPARLTKLGKAQAIAGFVAFDGAKKCYVLKLQSMPENYPTGELETDAVSLNKALEALILESPEQYMWLMKWYKTTAEGDEYLYG